MLAFRVWQTATTICTVSFVKEHEQSLIQSRSGIDESWIDGNFQKASSPDIREPEILKEVL